MRLNLLFVKGAEVRRVDKTSGALRAGDFVVPRASTSIVAEVAKQTGVAYEILPDHEGKVKTIAKFKDADLLESGWLLGESVIAGRPTMVSVPYGQGRVVLIGFRAQHRAQAHGTYKLLFNALMSNRSKSEFERRALQVSAYTSQHPAGQRTHIASSSAFQRQRTTGGISKWAPVGLGIAA